MTNKIEISHTLADRLTRAYPAEITDQETMQAIRIEALAALDELRAILAAPVVDRQSEMLDISTERNAMQRQRDLAVSQLKRECDDVDAVLRLFGLDPEEFRTDGGALNLAKLRNRTSPPAPVAVVIDERAEFEKSVIGKAERFHPGLSKYGIDGEYKHAQLQYAWDLWQARACLDKAKEMNK